MIIITFLLHPSTMNDLEHPQKRQKRDPDGIKESIVLSGLVQGEISSKTDSAGVLSDSDDLDHIPLYLQQYENHKNKKKLQGSDAYYLDTINRTVLDFDFSKECSVSLAKTNVYACLVCGKYFQGRSVTSPAFNHSINCKHHVFLNLSTESFYILPENYKLTDPETLKKLDDIVALLNPMYELDELKALPSRALDLKRIPYNVGYVGLNNISSNDYANVVLQLLCHIEPLRAYFLLLPHMPKLQESVVRASDLNAQFGQLMRKLWSNKLYKPHVSPHELLQLISAQSKMQFTVFQQQSPRKFLIWLLNHLHLGLIKATSRKKSSAISKSLQGSVKVTKIPVEAKEVNKKVEFVIKDSDITELKTKFWLLTVKPPANPLFALGLKLPEVSLQKLLEKYNGVEQTQVSETELHKYKLSGELPQFLIIHIDRSIEENEEYQGSNTVVKFPRVLDMRPYVEIEGKDKAGPLNYRLVGNIVYKMESGNSTRSWMIHLEKSPTEWVTIQNLDIRPCEPELMFLDSSYLQLWRKIDLQ